MNCNPIPRYQYQGSTSSVPYQSKDNEEIRNVPGQNQFNTQRRNPQRIVNCKSKPPKPRLSATAEPVCSVVGHRRARGMKILFCAQRSGWKIRWSEKINPTSRNPARRPGTKRSSTKTRGRNGPLRLWRQQDPQYCTAGGVLGQCLIYKYIYKYIQHKP